MVPYREDGFVSVWIYLSFHQQSRHTMFPVSVEPRAKMKVTSWQLPDSTSFESIS